MAKILASENVTGLRNREEIDQQYSPDDFDAAVATPFTNFVANLAAERFYCTFEANKHRTQQLVNDAKAMGLGVRVLRGAWTDSATGGTSSELSVQIIGSQNKGHETYDRFKRLILALSAKYVQNGVIIAYNRYNEVAAEEVVDGVSTVKGFVGELWQVKSPVDIDTILKAYVENNTNKTIDGYIDDPNVVVESLTIGDYELFQIFESMGKHNTAEIAKDAEAMYTAVGQRAFTYGSETWDDEWFSDKVKDGKYEDYTEMETKGINASVEETHNVSITSCGDIDYVSPDNEGIGARYKVRNSRKRLLEQYE